jgi:hypothetical protein
MTLNSATPNPPVPLILMSCGLLLNINHHLFADLDAVISVMALHGVHAQGLGAAPSLLD